MTNPAPAWSKKLSPDVEIVVCKDAHWFADSLMRDIDQWIEIVNQMSFDWEGNGINGRRVFEA